MGKIGKKTARAAKDMDEGEKGNRWCKIGKLRVHI